jgi:hypothetical protein
MSGAQMFGGVEPSSSVTQDGVDSQTLPILVQPVAGVLSHVLRSVMEPLGLSESFSNPVENP